MIVRHAGWTEQDIPCLRGRLAIVTGGTRGIGRATATALARAGAEVILAARGEAQATEALAVIRAHAPAALPRFEQLDLAELASVRRFAGRIARAHGALDILVNNAGIMALPRRHVTADGFERQLGVNHLGHFALTALLLPQLRRAPAPRVVSVTSLAHRKGRIDFEDLQAEHAYSPWRAYAQSKLAVLIFALELQRRSTAGHWGLTSLAAHPGWALTDLYADGPASEEKPAWIAHWMHRGTRCFGRSAVHGAGPVLYAATAPLACGGGLYGRRWLWEMRGPVAPGWIAPQALDADMAGRLWDVSARLTGQSFAGQASAVTASAPARR